MAKPFFFLLILLIPKLAFLQQLDITRYSSTDILPFNEVNCIAQDYQGFLWFASGNSVFQYNGKVFLKKKLKKSGLSSFVTKIKQLDKELYFFTRDGVLREKSDTIQTWLNLQGKEPADIVLTGTDTLILCNDGLYKMTNGLIRPSIPYSFSSKSKQTQSLFQLNDSLFCSFDLGSALLIINIRSGKIQVIKMRILDLFKSPENKIKYILENEGIGSLNLSSINAAISTSIEFTYPFPAVKNLSAVVDNQDRTWININNSGLLKIDESGTYKLYSQSDGFPDNWFSNLFADRESNIWAAQTNYLMKIQERPTKRYSVSDGLLSSTNTAIAAEPFSATIWIAGPEGINYMKDGKIFIAEKYSSSLKDISNIAVVDHSVVITSNNRVQTFVFESPNSLPKPKQLFKKAEGEVYELVSVGNNSILVSTSTGLYLHRPYVSPQMLSKISFRTLVKLSNNHILAADLTGSPQLINIGETPAPSKVSIKPVQFAESSYIKIPTSIRSAYEDSRGNIWIGTRTDGLFGYSRNSDSFSLIFHSSASADFDNPVVWKILETDHGKLFLTTSAGLYELKYLETGIVLEKSRVENSASYMTQMTSSGSNLYILSSPGLLMIPLKDTIKDKQRYQTFIHFVKNGSKILYNPTINKTYEFSPTENNLEIDFSSNYFTNEKRVRYSYTLVPSDGSGWSPPSGNGSLVLHKLGAGNYSFKVKAILPNGTIAETAVFNFFIAPPFWKTYWFWMIVASLFVLLTAYWIKLKQDRLKVETSLRNKIARDLHDDIGSTLSGINIYSKFAKEKLSKENTEIADILSVIEQKTILMMDNMSDIVWSINPSNDSFKDLIIKIKEYAAEVLEPQNIQFKFEVDDSVVDQKFDISNRRDIYLVMKEAINNIARHANATSATFQIQRKGKQILLCISDNGKGYNNETTGNGIRNMKERVSALNGEMAFEDLHLAGTVLNIIIPIP